MKDPDQEFLSRSPAQTQTVAAGLLAALGPGTVLALHGNLGAGKTCLIQGLARALGVGGPVLSPTFTLVNEYPGPLPLYHIDLYRIRDSEEALALGLDEFLHGRGITAIEWPEVVADLLPPQTIHIYLEAGAAPEERHIRIRAASGGGPS